VRTEVTDLFCPIDECDTIRQLRAEAYGSYANGFIHAYRFTS
jgi:hypothetical protein